MIIFDVVMLTFVCVAANHLGLISAVERVLKLRIPILNCSKCCTFWSVLFLCTLYKQSIVPALTMSLLCAYIALWIELFMGYIDNLYNELYEKIYTSTEPEHPDTSDGGKDCSQSGVSDLSEE